MLFPVRGKMGRARFELRFGYAPRELTVLAEHKLSSLHSSIISPFSFRFNLHLRRIFMGFPQYGQ